MTETLSPFNPVIPPMLRQEIRVNSTLPNLTPKAGQLLRAIMQGERQREGLPFDIWPYYRLIGGSKSRARHRVGIRVRYLVAQGWLERHNGASGQYKLTRQALANIEQVRSQLPGTGRKRASGQRGIEAVPEQQGRVSKGAGHILRLICSQQRASEGSTALHFLADAFGSGRGYGHKLTWLVKQGWIEAVPGDSYRLTGFGMSHHADVALGTYLPPLRGAPQAVEPTYEDAPPAATTAPERGRAAPERTALRINPDSLNRLRARLSSQQFTVLEYDTGRGYRPAICWALMALGAKGTEVAAALGYAGGGSGHRVSGAYAARQDFPPGRPTNTVADLLETPCN